MAHLVKLSVLLAFLVIGFRIPFLRDVQRRRRGINTLLGFVLVVSAAVGLAQRDAWPFTNYYLVAWLSSDDQVIEKGELRGLDAGGREWPIDPLAWAPVTPLTLQVWFTRVFMALPPARQDATLAFLLERAESSRRRLAQGQWIGPQRLLGPLAAPDWLLFKRPTAIPPPYVGVRAYWVAWRPNEKLVDFTRVRETLLGEYRPP